MKTQPSFLTFLALIILIILVASKPYQQTFDKISVHEFELLDKDGKQRVSIKVEDDGEVVFRLRDHTGAIRLKMGASEDGSGLVLLDGNTDSGIQALAKKSGTSLTVLGKDGKKKVY